MKGELNDDTVLKKWIKILNEKLKHNCDQLTFGIGLPHNERSLVPSDFILPPILQKDLIMCENEKE
jgi:hypothetical protein